MDMQKLIQFSGKYNSMNKMNAMKLSVAMIIMLLVTTGCGLFNSILDESAVSDESTVIDYNSFLEVLLVNDVTLEEMDEISQPFIPVVGRIIRVNGEDVQTFEFESESELADFVGSVSSTGSSIGTSMVSWMGTPHFYSTGRLLVIYVGDTQEQLGLLEQVLGTQFAGG